MTPVKHSVPVTFTREDVELARAFGEALHAAAEEAGGLDTWTARLATAAIARADRLLAALPEGGEPDEP
jgi:hypothetical protein